MFHSDDRSIPRRRTLHLRLHLLLIAMAFPSPMASAQALSGENDESTSARRAVTAEPLAVHPALTLSPLVVTTGEVLASVGSGRVKRFRPDGTLVQVLDTLDATPGNRNTTGLLVDPLGNLYVTLFTQNQSSYPGGVYKFDPTGTPLGSFGAAYNAHPESIVLDGVGNVFVGEADGLHRLLKFSPKGQLLGSFSPATQNRGLDWIDLAADQRTLYYTSEGSSVLRYDIQSRVQLTPFNRTPLPGTAAYALRILPTGGVLVADTEHIVRLDSDGYIVQQYDAPGESNWFAVNLDPDGSTFWSGGYSSGKIYRFDIATGVILASWSASPYTVLAGLSVVGERTAATSGPWVIPSSAFRQGMNGAEFHSDVRLLNAGTTSATVAATFYDQASARSVQAPPFTIAPKSQAAFDNILGTLFGMTLAAGAFGPIRFDSTGPIHVSSSVNNVNACGSGSTSGQWLPGIDVKDALTSGVLPQLAVSQNAASGYRSNLVVMNPGSSDATATVQVWGGGGVLLSTGTIGPLAANGFIQVPLDSAQVFPGVAGRTDSNLWVEFSSSQPVLVFASVINNASGDPFAIVATAGK